jgi:alkaline phosphatase D
VTSNNLDDITGDPTGEASRVIEEAFKQTNPHIKYLEFDEHGYSVLQVTPARVHMDWFKISDRRDRDATSEHMVSYNVPSGQQRVRRAPGPLH